VLEPLDRNFAGKGGVLDLGVRLEPIDALTVLAPEPVRILDALGIPFEVGLIVDQRVLLPRRLDTVNIDFRHPSPPDRFHGAGLRRQGAPLGFGIINILPLSATSGYPGCFLFAPRSASRRQDLLSRLCTACQHLWLIAAKIMFLKELSSS